MSAAQPKYTEAELQEMAQAALQSRESGDSRWFELVMRIAYHQDMPPHIVVDRIERLARGEHPNHERQEHAAAC